MFHKEKETLVDGGHTTFLSLLFNKCNRFHNFVDVVGIGLKPCTDQGFLLFSRYKSTTNAQAVNGDVFPALISNVSPPVSPRARVASLREHCRAGHVEWSISDTAEDLASRLSKQ